VSQGPDPGFNPYAPPQAKVDFGIGSGGDDGYGSDLLAPRGTRLGARILDGLVLMAVVLPGALIGAFVGKEFMWVLAGLGVLGLYGYQWYQSIGKRMLGIRVVKMDGSRVDFVSAVVLRSWVPGFIGAVPYLGACVGFIGYLMIFGDQQRCLHDHIANTKVILAGAGNA
jgi:uncharacterized RDD family membrane protein YckC